MSGTHILNVYGFQLELLEGTNPWVARSNLFVIS